MGRCAKVVAIALAAVLLPVVALAQGSIAGTVKDTSGAVLPGVTVEAASPVLIEKVRTVVTDGNGRLIAVAGNVNSLPVEFNRRFRGSVVRAPGKPAIVAAGGAMAYGVTLVLRRTSAGIVAFFLQYPLLFLIDPEGKPLGFLSKYMPLRGLLVAIVDPASVSEGGDDLGIRTLAAGVVMTAVWIFVILAGSGRLFSRAEIR